MFDGIDSLRQPSNNLLCSQIYLTLRNPNGQSSTKAVDADGGQVCTKLATSAQRIAGHKMGLVRITSWYPNFNGSHFALPPSEIHRMTGLPPKIV